jgi:hypothetical protein
MSYKDYFHTCECGSVYKVHRVRVAMRDKGYINCRCGREIVSWNEAATYTCTLVNAKKSGGA